MSEQGYTPEPDKYRKSSPTGPGQEYTPTEAESDRIEDAAERLRHYGYGHLAEAVERLAEARADERAKRPDREQLKATLAAHTCTSAHGLGNGVTVAYCQCDWWGTSEDYKNHRADAVLSSLALAPEAREVTDEERLAAQGLMNRHDACVSAGMHKPVQHRDGKPPWCGACGSTRVGLDPDVLGRFTRPSGEVPRG